MDISDSQHIGDTIRIRRPPKVFTDERGHTSWMSGIEPLELELASDAIFQTNPYDRCPFPAY